MVTHLLDSDISIDFLKGKELSKKILLKIESQSDIAVSVITLAEVLEGVISDQKRLEEAEEFIAQFEVLNLDPNIARIFALQRFHLRKAGNLIDNMDLLIASTALAHNLILITNNKKDFTKIKGLKLLS